MQVTMSKVRRIAILVGALAHSACGAGTSKAVPVQVSFSVAKITMATLASVELTVSGSDMTSITSTQAGPFTGDISFSVNVPVGSSRTFTATAAVQSVTGEGYQGTATADVAAAGGAVPITMHYMNFSAAPATTATGPQISSLSALYDNSDVAIYVDFAEAVELSTISGVVEIIPDVATTFRSQSIINQLKGVVDVTMPSPGSSYIIFNGTGSVINVDLYDDNDTAVVVPASANFQATLSGVNTIEIRMTQSAFSSLIDSAIVGEFNVLSGSLLSSVSPLTPTSTENFTASTAAASAAGGNVILYNAAFDTTTLQ